MRHHRATLGITLTAAVLLLVFSTTALAAAKPSVSLKPRSRTVAIGQTLKLTGTVGHPKAGVKTVTILREVGSAWQKLTTAKLSAKHAFTATVKLSTSGTWRLEAEYKAGGIKVRSKVATITVRTWTAVSCGWAHTLALRSDGTLWAWGDNDSGQLGLGSKVEKNSPTEVDPGSAWKAVSAGFDFTLAIKSNGSLWAWGDNASGELGLGNKTEKDAPVEVDPGTTWTAVSGGYDHAVAIRSDGTLWAWGSNDSGQLGLNNGDDPTSTPTQVGSATTWTAVAAGDAYTAARQSDGSLWGFGDNSRGELGLGDTIDEADSPAVIDASSWPCAAVSGTDWYTVAVRSDGTLWACGHNDDYQLGLGDTSDRTHLTQVGTDDTWKTVSCGYGFNLAVKTDGSLWAWGASTSGNLGLGAMDETVKTPAQVGAVSTWTGVCAGYEQTMALRSNGSLWACGDNFYGSLGLGTTAGKDTFTEVGS